MNINNLIRVRTDHLFGNHLHITGQHDKGDIILRQQLHFLAFLFFLCFFGNGKEVKRNAKTLGYVLQIGMIADDQRNLHIPLARRIPCQHIKKAV